MFPTRTNSPSKLGFSTERNLFHSSLKNIRLNKDKSSVKKLNFASRKGSKTDISNKKGNLTDRTSVFSPHASRTRLPSHIIFKNPENNESRIKHQSRFSEKVSGGNPFNRSPTKITMEGNTSDFRRKSERNSNLSLIRNASPNDIFSRKTTVPEKYFHMGARR